MLQFYCLECAQNFPTVEQCSQPYLHCNSLCVFTFQFRFLWIVDNSYDTSLTLMARLCFVKWTSFTSGDTWCQNEVKKTDPFLSAHAAVCCPDDFQLLACALTRTSPNFTSFLFLKSSSNTNCRKCISSHSVHAAFVHSFIALLSRKTQIDRCLFKGAVHADVFCLQSGRLRPNLVASFWELCCYSSFQHSLFRSSSHRFNV